MHSFKKLIFSIITAIVAVTPLSAQQQPPVPVPPNNPASAPNGKVSIVGAVNLNTIMLTANQTVKDVCSTQTFASDADPGQLTVYHVRTGTSKVVRFDSAEMLSDGDIIYVPKQIVPPQQYAIAGKTNNTGLFPWTAGIRIPVALGPGFDRLSSDFPVALFVNSKAKTKTEASNYEIKAGDIVYVPDDAFSIAKEGQQTEVRFYAQELDALQGHLLQEGKLTVADVKYLMANFNSDLKHVLLIQKGNSQVIDISSNTPTVNPVIQPGMTIYVPQIKSQDTVQVFGKVSHNRVQITNGSAIPLSMVLSQANWDATSSDQHRLLIMHNIPENNIQIVDYSALSAGGAGELSKIMLSAGDILCIPPKPDDIVLVGDLDYPGTYSYANLSQFPPGQNTQLTINRMLGFAQARDNADKSNVLFFQGLLTNPNTASMKTINGNSNEQIHPGDVVWVNEKSTTCLIVGLAPTDLLGQHKLAPNIKTTLSDIIPRSYALKFQTNADTHHIVIIKAGLPGVAQQQVVDWTKSTDTNQDPSINPGDVIIVSQRNVAPNASLGWLVRQLGLSKLPNVIQQIIGKITL